VSSNKEEHRNFERKYLGTVLNVDGIDYFVPLASPKDSDYYLDNNGNKVVRDGANAVGYGFLSFSS